MARPPPLGNVSSSRGGRPLGVAAKPGAGSDELAPLLASLRCLQCNSNGSLRPSAPHAALACTHCATRYPVFRCGEAAIPWLFVNPQASRLQWKARYHGFLQGNSIDLERLRSARAASGDRPATRARISRVLQARERYRGQVVELLAPFDLEAIDWPADTTAVLEDKLPGNLSLSSHVDNVFRDWAWTTGEHDASLDAVARMLDADRREHIGALAVLGAGACRLSYDMHRRYAPRQTISLDINPLLLVLGARVARGEAVELYEFPRAPVDLNSCAVLQRCRAPAALRDDTFHAILADALHLPLAGASVDTVVTAWLIDVLSQDLRSLLPSINRCLDDDGLWINSGSLAFRHRDESWCYSEDEILDLVEQYGFEIIARERQVATYLQSPHSANGRTEQIMSFCARKVRSVDAPEQTNYLPEWLRDTAIPVPASNAIENRSSKHLLTAHILGAIDGKKTVGQIGRRIARQYGLGLAETIQAVRQVLLDAWEESQSANGDRRG